MRYEDDIERQNLPADPNAAEESLPVTDLTEEEQRPVEPAGVPEEPLPLPEPPPEAAEGDVEGSGRTARDEEVPDLPWPNHHYPPGGAP